MMTVRALYAAEDRVAKVLERGGTVDFYGTMLDLGRAHLRPFHPAQLPLMQGMVAGLYTANGGVGEPPEVVLSQRAQRQAAYLPGKHRIVLPVAPWAWRSELVLLHELAHALARGAGVGGTGQRAAHGQEWRRQYCALVRQVVGPEAALLMMEALELEAA